MINILLTINQAHEIQNVTF